MAFRRAPVPVAPSAAPAAHFTLRSAANMLYHREIAGFLRRCRGWGPRRASAIVQPKLARTIPWPSPSKDCYHDAQIGG